METGRVLAHHPKLFRFEGPTSEYRLSRGLIELIVFIRSNPVVSDPRVEKEAWSLTTHGFKATVLGWDREGTFRKFESSGNKIVCRLRLRAPYDKMITAAYYPVFWLWVLLKLLKINPIVIHACDLDSMFPAMLYKLLKRETKVIFDVFDSYSMFIRSRSEVLSTIVLCLERFAASMSDALISVSEGRLTLFGGVKLKRVEIVMNCPDLRLVLRSYDQSDKPSKTFRIVYAGIIGQDRGLIEISKATKEIDDVEFCVAGRVTDNETLESIKFPHVRYLGQLKLEESLMLERSADVIPVLYNLRAPYHRFAGVSPNKLFEAMMLGVPIITNLTYVLQEVPCGIQVNYKNIAEIRNAILYIKEHPDVKRELGQNGRLAFEQKYNWSLMEKRLLTLYHQLLAVEDCKANSN